ncbi:MAG: hypothetical protein RDV41_03920 [Planctomycetota bacterium]|nr:hypothetical protein [Planctomycetota bacterium]
MEGLKKLLFFVNTVCALVLTIVGFLWSINLIGVPTFGRAAAWAHVHILADRTVVAVGCGIVIALVLAYLVLIGLTVKSDGFLRSKTKHGEIRIAVSAVEETLCRAVKSLPDVHDAKVTLLYNTALPDSAITVHIDFSTWEKASFKETGEKIEEVARARLERIADLSQTVAFDIYLGRIVEKVEPRVDTKRAAKEEQNVLKEVFRGLEYPIDAEQQR